MSSVQSSSSSYTGYTNAMRLTGFSGLDTESIIKQLMDAETIPLNSLKQKRQLVEWKQQSYQSVISKLKTFQTKYFDIVNRSTYMLSSSTLNGRSATTTNSAYVSATATSSASVGSNTIEVLQVAKAATAVSGSSISKEIEGNEITWGDSLSGKSLQVILDGVTKTISFDGYTGGTTGSTSDKEDLTAYMQTQINQAFGTVTGSDGTTQIEKVKVSFNGDALSLNTGEGSGATSLSVRGLSGDSSEVLGIGSSLLSNRISLGSTLEQLGSKLTDGNELVYDADGNIEFSINGKLITVNKSDTLSQVIDRVNSTTNANVVMKYDQLTDKISITSKQTGAGDTLKLAYEGGGSGFFEALGIDVSNPVSEENKGQDAMIKLNGQLVTRNSNNITVDGVTYTVKKAHESGNSETVTIQQDVDTAVNAIKSFVESYNELISNMNGLVNEKYDRNYQPLTDAQKEEMSEEEIEKWESKAKTGLLKNDSLISDLTLAMRKALYEPVKGTGLLLSDLGIASESYQDNGKLYVDEDKLRTALANNPDGVANLLNGESEENPTYKRTATSAQKAERYLNSGVFNRISDIINDNISTFRDSNGNKGYFLEKAGLEGDTTYTSNVLKNQLDDFDDRIDALADKLVDKETAYYKKFSTLETLLSNMNAQSSMISSWFPS